MEIFRACVFFACVSTAALIPIPRLRADAGDQTAILQQAIDSLPVNGVLDCHGTNSLVTSLQLKSNMTMQNCDLEAIPGALDFTAPVTIDGRSQSLSNITIRNVHVNGNRHGQTNIGYAHEENGGRHCFRLLGRVANVLIEHSSGSYCASDGIALVSYGVSVSDRPADLPFQHIMVRDSVFAFNRRQGGSADGLHDATFDHVVFSSNGTTVPGGLEGDHCDSVDGKCYGTGFWYEDYTGLAGEGLSDIIFSQCTFRDNFQRSLYFYTHVPPSAGDYQPRSHIRILNSYLDAGVEPLDEDYALQFQIDNSIVGGGAVFQNIAIMNSSIDGSVGFRGAADISLISSVITTSLKWLGYAAYTTNVAFRDIQPTGKQLAASMDPDGGNNPVVSYSASPATASAPPQSGAYVKGDIVWNAQNDSPSGWICTGSGTPCQQWKTF